MSIAESTSITSDLTETFEVDLSCSYCKNKFLSLEQLIHHLGVCPNNHNLKNSDITNDNLGTFIYSISIYIYILYFQNVVNVIHNIVLIKDLKYLSSFKYFPNVNFEQVNKDINNYQVRPNNVHFRISCKILSSLNQEISKIYDNPNNLIIKNNVRLSRNLPNISNLLINFYLDKKNKHLPVKQFLQSLINKMNGYICTVLFPLEQFYLRSIIQKRPKDLIYYLSVLYVYRILRMFVCCARMQTVITYCLFIN